MIFGISGYATVGKDTFADSLYSILSKRGIKCYRESFAKQLKLQMEGFLMEHLKISVLTQKAEEKKIIRPLLVAFGEAKRKVNPNYWVEVLDFLLLKNGLTIISDVRYENEADWILSKGGKILHLNRMNEDGSYIQPANKEEEINSPNVIEKCFHELCWNTISDKIEIDAVVSSFIDTFLTEELEEWKMTFPLSKE
jgi:hypothetical protein